MSEPALETGGYNPDYFNLLSQIEEEHFWFSARRLLIRNLVRKIAVALPDNFRLLEIGCGTGNIQGVLRQSCPRGTVLGIDLFLEGLVFAARKGHRNLIQADARNPPFTQSFDVITAFDVIEHLPDDILILNKIYSMLRPRGVVMLTVPAHAWLWSDFDIKAQHCRRYAKAELKTKLIDAGFTVTRLSSFISTTLPLVWLHRRLHKSRGKGASKTDANDIVGAELRIVPIVNAFLRTILRMEAQLLSRGIELPFGSSFVAIARRTA